MAHFDPDAALRFILARGSALDKARLGHIIRRVSDDQLWHALGPFQNKDGGWAYGIDPDYRGSASSVQSSLAALRLMFTHHLGEHPRMQRTMAFLHQCRLDDGTWHELDAVQAFDPPPWYAPAHFRLWESACIAGYTMMLGFRDFWPPAASYVREIWSSMPPSDQPHPYIAALILFGASAHPEDKSVVQSCQRALLRLSKQPNLDPHDAAWIIEALLASYIDPTHPLLQTLASAFAQHQQHDGGLHTHYGDHLRAETTLYAFFISQELNELRAHS